MTKDDAEMVGDLIIAFLELYREEHTPLGQRRSKEDNIRHFLKLAGQLHAAEEIKND